MSDLSTLFPSAGESNDRPLVSRAGAEELRRLVGDGVGVGETTPRSSSRELTSLVGEPEATKAHQPADLSSLWGGAAPEARSARSSSNAGLASLVGEPTVAVTGSGWAAPENAQVGRRPLFGTRRRQGSVNVISVAAATLAVLALAGTTTFAVVQRATANPADGAMVSLREQEAELLNATAVLQTSTDLYATSVAEAAAMVESGAAALPTLAGRIDQAPLDAAEAARAALAQVVTTPATVTVPVYTREQIDEKSLADVGRAIDDVRAAQSALPPLVDAARTARTTVVSAIDGYRAALQNLGAAIEADATKQLEANDAASDGFRTAVTDAASRIRSAQLAGGDGVSEMPSYAAAVDALRADNQRILDLRRAEAEAEAEAEQEQETPRQTPQSPTPSEPEQSDPQPTTPPDTTPTDPPAPTPSPSDSPSPDPVPEPEPVPVDPPVEGGTGGTP